MNRKISLLLPCVICICMFAYGVLPVQAANCQHAFYQVSAVPIPTGYIHFSESGHTIQYGRENICGYCGYRFFTNIEYKSENHHINNDEWHLTHDDNGNEFWYSNCTTPGCPYRLERRYY